MPKSIKVSENHRNISSKLYNVIKKLIFKTKCIMSEILNRKHGDSKQQRITTSHYSTYKLRRFSPCPSFLSSNLSFFRKFKLHCS